MDRPRVLDLIILFVILNVTHFAVQGCHPAQAQQASVGDQVAEPLWKIANACERIAKALEDRNKRP